MTIGEVESAERRALNLFDKWVGITGFVVKHTCWMDALAAKIRDFSRHAPSCRQRR